MNRPFIGISVFGRGGSAGPNGAPSALTVLSLSATSLQCDFTSASTNQDGYRLYMSTDNGTTYTLKTFGTGLSLIATGLTASSAYHFYVVAYKGSKESAHSNVNFGITLSAEYSALYASLTTKPSAAIKENQNVFLKELLDRAVWSDLDSARLLAQTVNSANEALGDWKDPTKIATLHGNTAPVFTANLGFQMLASALRYIDLIWKASDGVNYTVNDCSIIIFTDTNENVTGFDVGVYDGANYTQNALKNATYDNQVAIHGGTANYNLTAGGTSVGFWVWNRISATKIQIFRNGAQLGTDITSNASTNRPTASYFLGARNATGTADNYTNRRYGFIAFGKALTPAKVLSLYQAWNRYITYGKTGTQASAFVMPTHTASDLTAIRATIRARIWPGGYPATGVDVVAHGVSEVMASSAANLASIDRLTIQIAGINDRLCYTWIPTVSNGKFVIFHHDHFYALTGTDIYEVAGRADLIRALTNEGYTVCRIPMAPGNDGTEGKVHSYPTDSEPYNSVDDYHYFLDSTVRILNYYAGQFSAFYMCGMSGGAVMTSIMCALDERITKGFCVGASLPVSGNSYYGVNMDFETRLEGLIDIVDFGDLQVMGTTSNRKKMLVINAWEDPTQTGFNYATYLYAPFMTAIGAITSNFLLGWDTTTFLHEITAATRARAISFFAT